LLGNVLRWQSAYLAAQSPVLEATHPRLVRKVKPLYRLSEYETASYAFLRGIDYIVEECPFSHDAIQLQYKEVLNQLEHRSPGTKQSFVLGFLRSPRRREWRHLSLAEAYLVALFTEMFGVPLTIYLLGSVLGVELGLSGLEGHLWAALLARTGLVSLEDTVAGVMALTAALIILGLALMTCGWWQFWRSRGELVTAGLYRLVRHPQYTGFLLVVVAFLVQWPTIITLVMFPILAVQYYRLAKREEADLAEHFGGRWALYQVRTSMLIPGWPADAQRQVAGSLRS